MCYERRMEPRIIPRTEHSISRRQISDNALRTLYRLRDSGFIAYLVGGCVRDLLMGRKPKDFDIATNATPAEIRHLFRNCRLVGRRFRLAHLYFKDEILEVSTFRRQALPDESGDEAEPDRSHPPAAHVKNEDGMILRDNIFGTPEEDALRRDFTINALAYNIADFSVIDHSTGLEDLQARLIRPIGDPEVRFTEDPVRMLRAVRFAASHDFTIEPATWDIICRLSPTITRVSPARLYDEMQKLFMLGFARPTLRMLDQSGFLAPLFPFLVGWLSQGGDRATLLEENLAAFDNLIGSETQPMPSLMLAVLFGPMLDESAQVHAREDGMSYRMALELSCDLLIEEIAASINIPRRITSRMRHVLVLQIALTAMPPRRPATVPKRPGFDEAMAYLRIVAATDEAKCAALNWWESYLRDPQSVVAAPEPSQKKRRRRRRRPRTTPKTVVE